MKSVLVEVTGTEPTLAGRFPCLHCDRLIDYERVAPVNVEVPVTCPECGEENALRRLEDPGESTGSSRAALRRPYGCVDWRAVESSNLSAAGLRPPFVLVKFKKGGVYRYEFGRNAKKIFDDLISAESKGKFFHRTIRPVPATLLCAIYGCFDPADRESNQVLCETHLPVK